MENSHLQEVIPSHEIVQNVKNLHMTQNGLSGTYSGDIKNGKRHGQGVMKYSNVDEYHTKRICTGNWVKDVQEGQGTLETDHFLFSGTFKNNKLEGLACKKIYHPFGDPSLHWLINRFDGEFYHNFTFKNGVGTFLNGWTFHCDYDLSGKPHGKGFVKNCAGNVLFESKWRNGKCNNSWFDISSVFFHGATFFLILVICLAFLFAAGYVVYLVFLLGYWSFDFKYQVVGSDIYRSRRKHVMVGTYTGQIWHHERNGFGELVSPSLNYTGEWVNDKKHGVGVATLKGQGVYNGTWANDVRYGNGSMSWVDPKATNRGDVFVGEWRNDQMAQGVYTYRNGTLYTGSFADDMYHGYGVLNYTDGSSYAGQFNHNWREGRGTLTQKHGAFCAGEWFQDEKHGLFTCFERILVGSVTFNGLMQSEVKVSGEEIDVIFPYLLSARTTYNETQETSVTEDRGWTLGFLIVLCSVVCLCFHCCFHCCFIGKYVRTPLALILKSRVHYLVLCCCSCLCCASLLLSAL